MAQERCIRACLAYSRGWKVGDVRTVDGVDGEGRPRISDHFRLVASDEIVADKEFHTPEKVAEARRESGLLDKSAAVSRSLTELDPDRDEDWTARGYPSVARMHLLTGFEVSRGDVQSAYPGFDRDMAREQKRS